MINFHLLNPIDGDLIEKTLKNNRCFPKVGPASGVLFVWHKILNLLVTLADAEREKMLLSHTWWISTKGKINKNTKINWCKDMSMHENTVHTGICFVVQTFYSGLYHYKKENDYKHCCFDHFTAPWLYFGFGCCILTGMKAKHWNADH